MALHRKCFSLANNLPCRLKCRVFSSSCFKQYDKINNITNSNNRLSATSQVSGNFIHKLVTSRNFGGLHSTGAIGSNSLTRDHGYNVCTRDTFRTCAVLLQSNRHFLTSSLLREKEQQSTEKDTSQEKLAFHEGMALRLVNENGFLSWCRNSYISTVAGLGMINGSDTFMAQGAGYGILFIAGMNMLWGSGSHINNLIRLRKTADISRPTLLLHISGATFHALLYVFLLLIFFQSEGKSHWRHKKRDSHDERGHPWKDSGKFDHQSRGFDRREREKSSNTVDKL